MYLMETRFQKLQMSKPPTLTVWLLYFAAAGLLLLQLPLQGSLPGNWDSWFYLGLFNYYSDFLGYWSQGREIYTAFFPSEYPNFALGEPSPFNALLFLPIQWLIQDPIWSYYVYISILLSLNAIGLFLVTRQLTVTPGIAWLAGWLFMLSNYMLSSIDQQNVLSVYPALFCIFSVLRYKELSSPPWLVLAALFACIQLYCSAYHFFFLFIALLILSAFEFRYLLSLLKKPVFWIAIGCILLAVYPFAALYLLGDLHEQTHNFVDRRTMSSLSLHATDWFKTHPYNALYGVKTDQSLLHYIHAVGPGLVLMGAATTGWIMISGFKKKALYVSFIIAGLLLSFGPNWQVGDQVLASPLFTAMRWMGLDNLMRTPVRAFMLLLPVLCVLSATALIRAWGYHKWLTAIVIFLWVLENIPYRLQVYNSAEYITVPEVVMQTAQTSTKEAPLWILPSSLYEIPGLQAGLGEQNREYIYMYWQTSFEKNMINGMNAFVPIDNWSLRKNLDHQEVAASLVYLEQMQIDP